MPTMPSSRGSRGTPWVVKPQKTGPRKDIPDFFRTNKTTGKIDFKKRNPPQKPLPYYAKSIRSSSAAPWRPPAWGKKKFNSSSSLITADPSLKGKSVKYRNYLSAHERGIRAAAVTAGALGLAAVVGPEAIVGGAAAAIAGLMRAAPPVVGAAVPLLSKAFV